MANRIKDLTDGDVFSPAEWYEQLAGGWITADDGSGYWAIYVAGEKTILVSDVSAFGPMPEGANYVMWYNK